MATRQNSVRSNNLTTSLGGTIANDDVLLITEGADNYDAGLSFTAYTGLTIKAEGEFSGNIGTSGASVTFTGLLLRYAARGQVLYVSAHTGDIDVIDFAPQVGTRGFLTSSAGKVDELRISGGTFRVLENADVDAVNVYGGVLTVQEDGSNTMTDVLVAPNARMTTERSFATAQIQGLLVIDDTAAQFTGAVTVRSGGTLDVRAMASAGASSAVTVEPGGTVDLRNARTAVAFDDITWRPGSRLLISRDGPGYTAGGTETGTPDTVYA